MGAEAINPIEELKAYLRGMPPVEERAFEEAITRMLTESSVTIIEELDIILNSESDIDLRFRAFFGLTFYHRRLSNYSEFKRLVDTYIVDFQDISLHYHVLALLHKADGDREGILRSIQYGRLAVGKLGRHVGVLHNYCEAVVTAMEENVEVNPEDRENALLYIQSVVTLAPNYAKFYCTKGRILAQQHKFQEAKKNILYAIDLENSKANDYSIRISDYKNVLAQIRAQELYVDISHEIKEAGRSILNAESTVQEVVQTTKEQMEHIKTQNLQMLAFFTAIISFIIGSINILSKQQTFLDSAMLMLILAGILMLVNVGFSMLLTSVRQNGWKLAFVTLVGVALIASGFAAHSMLKLSGGN